MKDFKKILEYFGRDLNEATKEHGEYRFGSMYGRYNVWKWDEEENVATETYAYIDKYDDKVICEVKYKLQGDKPVEIDKEYF